MIESIMRHRAKPRETATKKNQDDQGGRFLGTEMSLSCVHPNYPGPHARLSKPRQHFMLYVFIVYTVIGK